MFSRVVTIFSLAVVSMSAMAQKDLVETARSSGKFTTFLRLSDSIGLTSTFRTNGPNDKGYTMLIPTDSAFKKVPAVQMQALEADRELLRRVLRNHVIVGRDLRAAGEATNPTTLSGDALRIQVAGSDANPDVSVNGMRLSGSPMTASNGVLYAVDTVMIPTAVRATLADKTALTVRTGNQGSGTDTDSMSLQDNGLTNALGSDYTRFASLMDKAGLSADYIDKGKYTMIVPTNAAFAAVPQAAMDAITADPALLRDLLMYHILSGNRPSSTIHKGIVSTINGIDMIVRMGPKGEMKFNQAVVLQQDIRTANGVAYGINTVLMPRVVIDALEAKGIKTTGG